MMAESALFGRYMREQNYAAAERICRIALRDPATLSIGLMGLVMLAQRIGRYDFEHMYLAHLAAPFADHDLNVLPFDHVVARTEPGGGARRFLVVCARDSGMWSDFASVVGAYMLAWRTDRIPITSWRSRSLYSSSLQQDAFLDFFEPLSSLSIDELGDDALSFDPSCWNVSKLKEPFTAPRPESRILQTMASSADVVVCRDYISPYLVLDWIVPRPIPTASEKKFQLSHIYNRVARPNRAIRKLVADFKDEHFAGEPFTAIHMRGTDKIIENADLAATNMQILQRALSETNRKLFVMTDDIYWLKQAESLFKDRLVVADVDRRSGRTAVHANPSRIDPVKLGKDIVMETFVAADADVFIGGGQSNVSATIDLIRAARDLKTILLGESNLLNDREWGLINW